VARLDQDRLTFGHVNALGAVRPLPAVAQAVTLLTPAEAATHLGHPTCGPGASFSMMAARTAGFWPSWSRAPTMRR
jgi:hypothetical protein